MSEIIAIVDELDKVIGAVEKDNFDKTSGRIYRTATLILFSQDGRILIQRRADSKKTYAGKWDIAAVAGHVVFGETYLESIIRETEEEIGLKNVNFFEAEKEFSVTAGGKRRFTQVFWAVEDFDVEDLKLPLDEVAEVRLVKVSELQKMFEEDFGKFANYQEGDAESLAKRISKIAQKMLEKSNNNY